MDWSMMRHVNGLADWPALIKQSHKYNKSLQTLVEKNRVHIYMKHFTDEYISRLPRGP